MSLAVPQRFVLVLSAALLLAAAQAPRPGEAPAPRLPDDPATPLLEYRLVLGQIGAEDNAQWIRIYPDGRGVAHFPSFMRRAGNYELRMVGSEVEELARFVVARGVLDFDVAEVKRQKSDLQRQLLQRHKKVTARSGTKPRHDTGERLPRRIYDAPTTVLEFNLGAPGAEVSAKRISWYALQWDAEWYPEIEPLRKLAAVEQRLQQLFERDDLLPLE